MVKERIISPERDNLQIENDAMVIGDTVIFLVFIVSAHVTLGLLHVKEIARVAPSGMTEKFKFDKLIDDMSYSPALPPLINW